MPLPLLQLGMAGAGALGGILSGGRSGSERAYEGAVPYWLRRMMDQEQQATTDYGGRVDPSTGQWVQGSRGAAQAGFNEIYDDPGFTPGEVGRMEFSPEEAESFRYSPEEAGSFRFSPEEAEAIRVSPEEEAATIRLSGLPVAGAANRAQQNLMRYSSAAGFNPGMNATLQRIQQEQGRQAAEAATQARLGIMGQRREGAETIARQRAGAAERVAGQRIRGAGTVAQRRSQIPLFTGQARMSQRRFGATGRAGIAAGDRGVMMGMQGPISPLPSSPGMFERGVQGASSMMSLFP